MPLLLLRALLSPGGPRRTLVDTTYCPSLRPPISAWQPDPLTLASFHVPLSQRPLVPFAMVSRLALLALATSVLGNQVYPAPEEPYPEHKPEPKPENPTYTTGLTTYTTTTICPVTSTVTSKGT